MRIRKHRFGDMLEIISGARPVGSAAVLDVNMPSLLLTHHRAEKSGATILNAVLVTVDFQRSISITDNRPRSIDHGAVSCFVLPLWMAWIPEEHQCCRRTREPTRTHRKAAVVITMAASRLAVMEWSAIALVDMRTLVRSQAGWKWGAAWESSSNLSVLSIDYYQPLASINKTEDLTFVYWNVSWTPTNTFSTFSGLTSTLQIPLEPQSSLQRCSCLQSYLRVS